LVHPTGNPVYCAAEPSGSASSDFDDMGGMPGRGKAPKSKNTPVSHGLHLIRHRGVKRAWPPPPLQRASRKRSFHFRRAAIPHPSPEGTANPPQRAGTDAVAILAKGDSTFPLPDGFWTAQRPVLWSPKLAGGNVALERVPRFLEFESPGLGWIWGEFQHRMGKAGKGKAEQNGRLHPGKWVPTR
jgi:hypothetical protein